MKRIKHPILVCLGIVVVASLADWAITRWLWPNPPSWYREFFPFVTVMLPVMFIARPFLFAGARRPDTQPPVR